MMAPQQHPQRLPDVDSLPPFDPEAKCPKCGHTEIEAKYRTWRGAFSQRVAEWIRRMCYRCGYLWDERCLATERPTGNWDTSDEDWDDDDAEA